jgi:hypothetical protein
MALRDVSVRVQGIGLGALLLGLAGFALFWWTPLGMVASLAGLIVGLIGWQQAPPLATGSRALSTSGLVLSAAALCLNVLIALQGLELIQFGPLR